MKLKYRNERNAKIIADQYGKPLDQPDWYNINAVSDNEADILLFDYIGWPYNDERDFIVALEGIIAKEITIRINSPGGDVFSANAIFNAIRAHSSKPITRIESIAASAASYIAAAGYKKQAYKNTMVMIHEPMTGIWGNQFELREVADVLQQISGIMVDMYADNVNIGKKDLRAMMKAETWMTAKEAKEKGFIDTIIEPGKSAKASFDLSIFSNLPDELKPKDQPDELNIEPDIRSIEKLLRDVGGLSKSKAKAVLARGWQAVEPNEATPIESESQDDIIRREAEVLARITKNINLLKGK